MAKRQKFENPLEGIDPIMEQAFSLADTKDSTGGLEGYSHDHHSDLDSSVPNPVSSDKEKKGRKPKKEADIFIQNEDQWDEQELNSKYEDSIISQVEFPDLTEVKTEKKFDMSVFKNIPVTVTVELGRSQISLKEVFELTEGSIVELERLVGEPLDLVVNGQVIAQGEVVAVDNNYGLRITNVLSAKED
jgi:flagellar motor switch protein FliN/FliY